MLSREKKSKIIEDLIKEIKESQAVLLVDFSGLKVAQDRELRKILKEVGIKMKIAKKTLIQRAFQQSGIKFNIYQFPASVALVFSPEEGIVVSKKIYEFSKTNEALKILGGFLNNEFLSAEEIKELAKLPSREILLSQLIYLLDYLPRTLVGVLKNGFSKLAIALEAIAKKKE